MNYLKELQALTFADIEALDFPTVQLHLVGINTLTDI